jgi:serine/threonine protein kinase/predicted Zn-dependent protease
MMIGEIFGQYKILKKLGEGGMGEVYLAEDTKLKRKVALKFLPSKFVSEEEKARFLQEAQAAAAINHANVCTVYEIQEQGESPFIAMEYIDGDTLKSKIQTTELTVDNVVNMSIQIADALHTAHEQGIIHRDIKSDNIMIFGDNQVKVADFGLAKLKGTVKLTKTSSTIGTLAYMAPEQIEGKEVDARSDIFSFGVVLYEMLCGKLPFEGDYDAALMYSILNEEPEPVQNHRPDISSEFLHVINRAMEKDPDDRYQSVKDMLIDLRRLKRDSSRITRETLAEIPVPSLRKRRSRKNLWVGLGVSLIIFITAYFIYNQLFPEKISDLVLDDERSLAVMYFANNTGDKNLDHWRRALSDLMISDISQSKYLRVLGGDKLYDILKDLGQLESTNFSAEVLQEVAKNGRTTHVVYGNLSKAGENFRINITIKRPATGELIGTEMVEGRGEESIFPMVDELTTKIKSRFNFSSAEIASDIDKDVANITTSSPKAYKFYVLGRGFFNQREYRESIKYMEEAIAVDPEFAMAYRSIAIANSNMGYSAGRRKYLHKAIELSDRVSEREKYLIQGDYFYDSDKRKSIEAYEKLLSIYPYDNTGNNNLGYLYNGIEELEKAIKCFEAAIKGDPSLFTAYMNCAWAYMEMARYDEAKNILMKYQNNYADNEIIRSYFSEFHLYKREFDLALMETDKAIKLKPDAPQNYVDKSVIYMCMGDFVRAENILRELLEWEEKSAQAWGRGILFALNLLQGKTNEMKIYAEAGLEIARQIGEISWECYFLSRLSMVEVLHENYEDALRLEEERFKIAAENDRKGQIRGALSNQAEIYLKSGRFGEAEEIAERLKAIYADLLNKKGIRNYYHLMGKIEIAKQNYTKAIDYLNDGLPLLRPNPENGTNAYMYYTLSQAHYYNGELDKAKEWFNKLTSLTYGRSRAGHIFARSFYYLGKIFQEKDQDDKAIEHFQKFLDLWGNADYDFPEIKDAQERLASLKGS